MDESRSDADATRPASPSKRSSAPNICTDLGAKGGATILEFVLVIIFIFLVLGGIFDIGVGIHEYSFLNYTTTKAAHNISLKLATTKNCNVVDNYLINTASKEMKNAMAAGNSASWTYTYNFSSAGSNPLSTLQLTGAMPISCYFICRVLPPNWTVRVTATATLDIPNFKSMNCADGGPVP